MLQKEIQVPIRMFIYLWKSFSNCLHKSNMQKIKRLALLFVLLSPDMFQNESSDISSTWEIRPNIINDECMV